MGVTRLMNLPGDVRCGSQTPRIAHIPQTIADFSAGEDAIDLIAIAGKELMPWQASVVRNALGITQTGKYAALEVAVNAPRQNGKNVIIEAIELYNLFLNPDCKVITHTAHLFSTARKSFSELEAIIRDNPWMFSRVAGAQGRSRFDDVRGIRTSSAEMSIKLADGSKITYVTRTGRQGRGLTGDLVVLDEAFDLDEDQIASLMPTMAARTMQGNPQILYTSSAGMLSSATWERVRDRALSGADSALMYVEWSADDTADSGDIEAWYQANPSLGRFISEDYIRNTELVGMADEQFRRERLGIWARVGDEAAIQVRDWAGLVDPDSEPSDTVAFAVDVPPTRDWAEIAVASIRDDGRIHVELVDRQVGTDWVADRLAQLQEAWSPVAIVVEAGSAAGSLIGQLRRQRVRLLQVSAREYFQACGRFYDLVRQGVLVHIGQEEMDQAVSGAKMKFVGDSLFKWVRREELSNISPLVAATLAVAGIEQKGMKPVGARRSGWKVVSL
ncbi:terminase [Trueperella sp. LYQ143]|uniref:terminase n=1 Tax=Trueperella sp. LYQ143 TaxID=3391059 RepID=UPI00398375DF